MLASNRGTSDSALFFLTGDYWSGVFRGWFGTKAKQTQRQLSSLPNYQSLVLRTEGVENDTVQKERERVQNNLRNQIPVSGLRLANLGKVYPKYPFGLSSSRDFVALKNIYLEVEQGELFALLGYGIHRSSRAEPVSSFLILARQIISGGRRTGLHPLLLGRGF